eukprot:TRINITY_DN87804_c0_g1_i1.p1 TRINITY_DN87804_c0_g1~~TRINITY_DN87804_c0_g1_i1.p1  ORF type:complete len:253 (+),score=35.12 TRINITY_DN87804_c0_g1_i1:31-759(+)
MAPLACPGGTCELFGIFGILVQVLIGAWCLLTLLVLWRMETPRRPFMTWLGDMSKQMVGAGYGHFLNIFVALLFGEELESAASNNQCVWYLVGFLSDIFFCTFLCWVVTKAMRPVIKERCGIDIGDYDSNDNVDDGRQSIAPWVMWCLQTGIWLGIMTAVKAVVSLGVYLAQGPLYGSLASAFHVVGLCHHQRAQLLVSVVFVPIIGDAFQFAVQDSFLKNTEAAAAAAKLSEDSEKDSDSS